MTEYSRLELEWAARVFLTLVTDTKAKLEHGAKLRQEMVEAFNKGQKPTGYRPQWIVQSARELVAHMATVAEKFNSDHPADQASALDLMDILLTAVNLLKTQREAPKKTEPKVSQA